MLLSEAIRDDGSPFCSGIEIESIKQHALRDYPNECYGILTDVGYKPLENISPSPKTSAWSDGVELTKYLASGNLRALVHSHPDGPNAPSEADMRGQEELDAPWIIVSTNGSACLEPFIWGDSLRDERDLVGRKFQHGVDDCYALIRAWYKQERDTLLGDYPRNWEWWIESTQGEKNLYEKYFSNEGFTSVDSSTMEVGDVWLATIRSKVPNHAGIYIGGGLMIHHPSSDLAYDPRRLSKREPIARWERHITHWLRRG